MRNLLGVGGVPDPSAKNPNRLTCVKFVARLGCTEGVWRAPGP